MKKLLTIAAALIFAAASYAATTAWDYNIYFYDTDGNDLAGTLDIIQNGTTLSSVDLVDGTAEGSIAAVEYGEGVQVTTRLTTTLQSGETISKDYTFDFVLPMPGKPDNQSSLSQYADNAGGAFVGDSGIDLGMSAADATAAGWTVVPEPCSVALLAIGLAAFGLKRKIA